MRDLFIVGVILLMALAAFRRPFAMTLAYIYVDLVQPQEISWYLLNSIPLSFIFGAAAVLFFFAFDRKRNLRFGPLQLLMLLFLAWITFTTFIAQLPEFAWVKWGPAWKALIFAAFLPLVLQTRLRLEGALMFIVLCVGCITITGGIKTVLGGGGYGTLAFLVDRNAGLYEGSTISTVAISIIPLILYLARYNIIVAHSKWTRLFAAGLVFAAVLIPVGTEARTGLVCLGVLAVLLWLGAKRKILFGAGALLLALASIPFLPDTFTGRMQTIQTYDEDTSASTRLAVWGWTLDFVRDHPLGGGFGAYRLNKLEVEVRERSGDGNNMSEDTTVVTDRARAFHSSYFEVLGEHGYPGLAIFLAMLVVALVQLRRLYTRFRDSETDRWIADMARAVGHTLIVYMAGSIFVGVAFQSTQYYLLATTAALAHIASRRAKPKAAFVPGGWKPTPVAAR